MKTGKLRIFAVIVTIIVTFTVNTQAGTFKAITIDGSFGDWAGVPLASTQPQDVTNVVAYKDIYVANDNDYLYIRFSIYPPAANPFTAYQNLFIDSDQNAATGYTVYGGVV